MINEIKKNIKKISVFREENDFQSALSYCDELIKENPNAWIFYREKADILESLKEYQNAIDVREELVNQGSEEPCDCYDLSRLSLSVGNNLECVQWSDKCLALCELHQDFYYQNASLFYKANALLNLICYQEAISVCNLLPDGYGTYLTGIGMRKREDIIRLIELRT